MRTSPWILGLAVATLPVAPVFAADVLLPGKVTIVKLGKLAKFVAKPANRGDTFPVPAPGSAGDPTTAGAGGGGGRLDMFDVGGAAGANSYDLPSGVPAPFGWKGLGNPAGSKGYRYKGTGQANDPCRVVLVKDKVVKAVCKGAGVTLQPPFGGDEGIVLSLGAALGERYCALFGGTVVKNQSNIFKRKLAPAPGACPAPGGGTTTTSSTMIGATSTTTSTSIDGGACCNGDSFISVSTIEAPGDCGDILNQSGAKFTDLACAGLYTGGGGNSVPLPLDIPDMGQAVSAITACAGQAATLGPTTSAQTGSNLNCTSPGCLFGAPLAVPNPGTPPTSVCVLNRVEAGYTGSTDCGTGETTASLPLSSILFLTGDTATDPGGTIAGVQPCPLCSNGMCIGGANDGGNCTQGTSALNEAYPTSHDCPPSATFDIGTLPIGLNLTTGTVTWNAVPGTGGSGQLRVFSGFCRDADDTGAFEDPANHCLENGMAVGAGCTGTFEACEQRNTGAFGPAGGGNKTITAIGTANGLLGGPAFGTLVSIFSVPPTFNATVDAAGDLPGPGAVAIPGTAETCPTANPCP